MVQVRVRQTHYLHHVDVKSLIRLQDTLYLYNHSIGFRRHPYRAFREVGTSKGTPSWSIPAHHRTQVWTVYSTGGSSHFAFINLARWVE